MSEQNHSGGLGGQYAFIALHGYLCAYRVGFIPTLDLPVDGGKDGLPSMACRRSGRRLYRRGVGNVMGGLIDQR